MGVTYGVFMKNKDTIRKKWDFNNETMSALLEDPTRSSKQMAEMLHITRQKLWREKKMMEEEDLIWGYSAIIDEGCDEWVDIIILLRLKSMPDETIKGIIEGAKSASHKKYSVRLRDVFYIDGEYDAMVVYSAPDIMTARRYYEFIRLSYGEFLMEKPIMMEVNFAVRRGGKLNPDVDRLMDLWP